jgi:hypothetical protein
MSSPHSSSKELLLLTLLIAFFPFPCDPHDFSRDTTQRLQFLLRFSATLRITESKKGGCNRHLQAQEMTLQPSLRIHKQMSLSS